MPARRFSHVLRESRWENNFLPPPQSSSRRRRPPGPSAAQRLSTARSPAARWQPRSPFSLLPTAPMRTATAPHRRFPPLSPALPGRSRAAPSGRRGPQGQKMAAGHPPHPALPRPRTHSCTAPRGSRSGSRLGSRRLQATRCPAQRQDTGQRAAAGPPSSSRSSAGRAADATRGMAGSEPLPASLALLRGQIDPPRLSLSLSLAPSARVVVPAHAPEPPPRREGGEGSGRKKKKWREGAVMGGTRHRQPLCKLCSASARPRPAWGAPSAARPAPPAAPSPCHVTTTTPGPGHPGLAPLGGGRAAEPLCQRVPVPAPRPGGCWASSSKRGGSGRGPHCPGAGFPPAARWWRESEQSRSGSGGPGRFPAKAGVTGM